MLNILIAEAEEPEFGYEVIAVVDSETEARELAASDLASRLKRIDRNEDPGICPYVYKMFQRGIEGYAPVLEILAADTAKTKRLCTDVRCELPASHAGACEVSE